MSLVFDVSEVSVDEQPFVAVGPSVASIEFTTETIVPSVAVDAPVTPTAVVEVPGLRGEPGLKNVYVQANDPAIEFGWGVEETNYIWIKP